MAEKLHADLAAKESRRVRERREALQSKVREAEEGAGCGGKECGRSDSGGGEEEG